MLWPPIDRSTASEKPVRIWNIAAGVAWTIAMAILIVRSAWKHHHTIAFDNFRLAGYHWMQGELLYADWRGFVYSPVLARLPTFTQAWGWPSGSLSMPSLWPGGFWRC